MRYEIKGGMMPVVEIILEAGESINCEKGAMVWMSPNMQMQTSGGGVGKMFTSATARLTAKTSSAASSPT